MFKPVEARVLAVSASSRHTFTKQVRARIRLAQGIGVEGDAHAGSTVKHRSRVRKDPTEPNLRQVHLIEGEVLDELNAHGFELTPGAIGENILTKGIDLHGLPRGARLLIGEQAVIVIQGLRHPCRQLNTYRNGLMDAVLFRDEKGQLVRRAGLMGTVLVGGEISPADKIWLELRGDVLEPLGPV
jgi:MOSC domain-containing protein YiiM